MAGADAERADSELPRDTASEEVARPVRDHRVAGDATSGRFRIRADDRLVESGSAASRAEAARLILAGLVTHAGERIDKAGQLVACGAALAVRDRARFVSRGGSKLEAALDHFAIDCQGVIALDAGCSTGGFTHCLLERGAARVYAVDVGYGQFAWKLRGDARVVLMERTNIRAVQAAALDPRPVLVVADLSFVSLRSVLDVLLALAAPAATFVLLVKPQFEVAPEELERGVVVSTQARAAALAAVEADVAGRGLVVAGALESPIRGADGNVEFLLAARRAGAGIR